jgi:hypothetical protein
MIGPTETTGTGSTDGMALTGEMVGFGWLALPISGALIDP